MSVMIQIRNVPQSVHKKLKARAALEGVSLSDYLLEIVTKAAERPTTEQLLERIAQLEPVRVEETAAQAIRKERDRA